VSLIIDIFVAVLLVSAIGYGMVLNRRIVALRRDQANLERLAISFHEATSRAESSVGNLKKAAQSASQILNEGIDDATRIRADLDFLIDRGEKLGDRLEGSVRQAENSPEIARRPKAVLNPVEPANEFEPVQAKQNLPARQNRPANVHNAEFLGNEIVKSEAERELIKALQAVR
jgi:hypothetical protein